MPKSAASWVLWHNPEGKVGAEVGDAIKRVSSILPGLVGDKFENILLIMKVA